MPGPRLPRLALLAVLALAAAVPAAAAADAARLASLLRAHPLRGLDGAPLPPAAPGEVVVVNFWASWCPPCRRELPALDALHARLRGQGGRVVAISVDEDPANARRFARAHGLTLPIAHDGPAGLAERLPLEHLPFTVVLDRAGRVAFTSAGRGRAAADEVAAVAERLAGVPAAAVTAPGGNP